jgi:hypothetical protein
VGFLSEGNSTAVDGVLSRKQALSIIESCPLDNWPICRAVLFNVKARNGDQIGDQIA